MSKNKRDNLCNEKQEDIANVLIADDDSELARFMLEILARKGLRGHLANDKDSAISFVSKGSCDLVLFAFSHIELKQPRLVSVDTILVCRII